MEACVYKTCALLIAMLGLGALQPVDSFAWDGKRKGFILNGGPAIGSLILKQSALGFSGTENKLAIGTDFRIGYAPNNRTAIVISAETSWYRIVNVLNNRTTFMSQVNGIGIMHWLKPEGPSILFTATVGLGVFDASAAGSEPSYGPGLAFSVGGEVAPHVNIHGGMTFAKTTDRILGVDFDSRNTSFRAIVSFTGY
jgi:hypothetical protein